MKKTNISDIQNIGQSAYRKLKYEVYYETYDLYIKEALAKFECSRICRPQGWLPTAWDLDTAALCMRSIGTRDSSRLFYITDKQIEFKCFVTLLSRKYIRFSTQATNLKIIIWPCFGLDI